MYSELPTKQDELSWEELNRNARMIENELDGKIISFSKIIANKTNNSVSINMDGTVMDNSHYSIDTLDKDIDRTLNNVQLIIIIFFCNNK